MDRLATPTVPVQQKKPQLLRRLGMLGLIGAAVTLANSVPGIPKMVRNVFFVLMLIVPLVYVAYVVLKTRDLLLVPETLHPTDMWLCGYSGPLTSAIAVLWIYCLIVARAIGEQGGDGSIFVAGDVVSQAIYFLMEVGFVLALVCLNCTKDFQRARPVFLWKAVSIPLTVIYGTYVFFMPLAGLGRMVPGPD